jgi:nicotinamidase-related amidase
MPGVAANICSIVNVRSGVASQFALIDSHDSLLIVIDVQDHFLAKLESQTAAQVTSRVRWLVQVAGWFRIPVIVTTEDPAKNGPTTAVIRDVLPRGAFDRDKSVFGLPGQPEILVAVQSTRRKTLILVGLETDVCIQHSALGLMDLGYRVAVVVDATAAPDIGHEIGLGRMKAAGITLLSCKGLFYEWMRDLTTTRRFTRDSGVEPPADLYLG